MEPLFRAGFVSSLPLPFRIRTENTPNRTPDIVLLHKEDKDFFSRHPGPADIALLIEVADTTIETDRSVKYKLYARAGIAEYWIIDIPNQRIVVCRRPAGDEYKSVTIFAADEEISPLAAPGLVITTFRNLLV